MSMNAPQPLPLPSDQVVISAPLSLTGSAERIWKITRGRSGWALAGLVTLAVLAIVLAWAVVLCWYLIFGLWLVPYRLIRRGQRKRKRDTLRHAEMMAAIRQQQRPTRGTK